MRAGLPVVFECFAGWSERELMIAHHHKYSPPTRLLWSFNRYRCRKPERAEC